MGLADTLAAMKNGTPPAAPAASPNLGPALVGSNPFAPTAAATAPPQSVPPAVAPNNPFATPAAAQGGAVNPFAPVQGSAPPPAPPPVPGGLINPPERNVQVEDPSEPLSAGAPAEAPAARGPGRPRKTPAAGAAPTMVASSPAVEVAIVEALGAFSNLCNVLARKFS